MSERSQEQRLEYLEALATWLKNLSGERPSNELLARIKGLAEHEQAMHRPIFSPTGLASGNEEVWAGFLCAFFRSKSPEYWSMKKLSPFAGSSLIFTHQGMGFTETLSDCIEGAVAKAITDAGLIRGIGARCVVVLPDLRNLESKAFQVSKDI